MLPIDDVLPDLIRALKRYRRAVVQAPPGAGKTTGVPLALLEAGIVKGRIVMLEPRRLAARAAATRMAELLGTPVGATVGYRIRGQTRVSAATRIEVVTEGILTRMIQDTPDLPGIGAVIFDEFHERSLVCDLGLALCLDVAGALREDLALVVMSATLEAGPLAERIGAPVITSHGRSFDVDIRFSDRPRPGLRDLPHAMAETILKGLRTATGSVLAFLPGEGEIRRTATLLEPHVPGECDLHPLFGALPFDKQRAAIRPAGDGRRNVVLATAIAETSLTLADTRIVVDGGYARRAVYDPGSGMTRLVTGRVTRAEAAQRAGRAGRVAAGLCLRLWTRGEDGALAAFPEPEIRSGDLAGLALELAQWGAAPQDLIFLDAPHEGRWHDARALLRMLGALDARGQITEHGKKLCREPLHPRLAHMLISGGRAAAPLAALLADRDPMRGAGADLSLRLRALAQDGPQDPRARPEALSRIRTEARRLARRQPDGPAMSPAALAALAYPDRIALRRPGDAPRFHLSGGKGARLDPADPLAGERLLVATDLDGDATEATVRLALPLSESELRASLGHLIGSAERCDWSRRTGRVIAHREERLGALVLRSVQWRDVPPDRIAAAMLEGIRQLGLRPTPAAERFLTRARRMPPPFPRFDPQHLMDTAEDWLAPHLAGVRSAEDWAQFDLLPALEARLDWPERQALDARVPSHFQTPLGRRVPIDYASDPPGCALRLQELFGVTRHPVVAGMPLRLTLLSPAGRPVQVTADLPGFWDSTYADVRKDMRGRYPKHSWPEDPRSAQPTLRSRKASGRDNG